MCLPIASIIALRTIGGESEQAAMLVAMYTIIKRGRLARKSLTHAEMLSHLDDFRINMGVEALDDRRL